MNGKLDGKLTSKPKVALEKVERDSVRRHEVVDRRSGIDRRALAAAQGNDDPNLQTNLERRRGPGRRRTDFMKSAEEGEMSQEQFLFVLAIDAFKRVNGKTFPTRTDVLEVIRKLGYRKTMPSELSLGKRAEDWTERPDAPCGVFKETED
jgi:hypothetical protein